MNIQGFQRLTLIDYPGKIASLVFTGGCNLNCLYCHNRDLVKKPFDHQIADTSVLEYLSKRADMIEGVCITGGEPLLQPDLLRFVERVKEFGLSVKLDTNGTLPMQLERALKSSMIDYIAMDIKAAFDNYKLITPEFIDFENIKTSIKMIQESGIEHEFRTTAIKGVHTEKDFDEISLLIGSESKYYLQNYRPVKSLNKSISFTSFSEFELVYMLGIAQKNNPTAQIR